MKRRGLSKGLKQVRKFTEQMPGEERLRPVSEEAEQ